MGGPPIMLHHGGESFVEFPPYYFSEATTLTKTSGTEVT
jgi:hypothetical protein